MTIKQWAAWVMHCNACETELCTWHKEILCLISPVPNTTAAVDLENEEQIADLPMGAFWEA